MPAADTDQPHGRHLDRHDEVYTGQWNRLLVGIRTGFTLKFLGERFIDNGQYAFLAYLRGDIQLARPAAFAVDLGVRS
jgi:HK97 family phage major capsid protein